MHRNPVKRGLVDTPEQWRWSSFRFYLYREPGLVNVNDTDILLMQALKLGFSRRLQYPGFRLAWATARI